MAQLPREVMKWVQGLQLHTDLMNPRHEASNGYVVAEIFAKFYPSVRAGGASGPQTRAAAL